MLARNRSQLHQKIITKRFSTTGDALTGSGNQNGLSSVANVTEACEAGTKTAAQTARFASGPAAGVKNCERNVPAGCTNAKPPSGQIKISLPTPPVQRTTRM